MKARVKSTGEIVEIKDLYDDGTALVGNMYIKVSELNFLVKTLIGNNVGTNWQKTLLKLLQQTTMVLILMQSLNIRLIALMP